MTVMVYVARFTVLARFGDAYVATDIAKVRRFENGLKLSIRAKILGLHLQDMDSMVRTALAIEREMEDARGIRNASAGEEGGSTFFEFRKETEDFCPTSAPGIGPARADDMFLLPSVWAHETELSTKAGIPKLWDSTVPIINGTSANTVCSFSPSVGQRDQYQSQGAGQAPSTTQIGQRGQILGRGQGQGSQARTLGTQGLVYAIVP